MKNIRAAVIAGTPVDTKMGVDFLISKGVDATGYPISATPEEQSALQILSPDLLKEHVRIKLQQIKAQGINVAMVYCNSMSAAVDMDKLSEEENINIVTPYTAYRHIADNYKLLGLMAANNQSAAGIEKVIQKENPECDVLGLGILPLVVEIEKGTPPREIIDKFCLKDLMAFFTDNKAGAVILGCTHFPYLKDELEKLTTLPVIDPAELMYKRICEI